MCQNDSLKQLSCCLSCQYLVGVARRCTSCFFDFCACSSSLCASRPACSLFLVSASLSAGWFRRTPPLSHGQHVAKAGKHGAATGIGLRTLALHVLLSTTGSRASRVQERGHKRCAERS